MGLATEVSDSGVVRVKNIRYGSPAFLKDVEIGDLVTGVNGITLSSLSGGATLTAELVEEIISKQPRPLVLHLNGNEAAGRTPGKKSTFAIVAEQEEKEPMPPSVAPSASAASVTPESTRAQAETQEREKRMATQAALSMPDVAVEDADMEAFKEVILQGIEVEVVTERRSIFSRQRNTENRLLFMTAQHQHLCCSKSTADPEVGHCLALDQLHAFSTSKTDTLQMVITYSSGKPNDKDQKRLAINFPTQRARDAVVVHLARLLRELKAPEAQATHPLASE